jgi:hypothetical protein
MALKGVVVTLGIEQRLMKAMAAPLNGPIDVIPFGELAVYQAPASRGR